MAGKSFHASVTALEILKNHEKLLKKSMARSTDSLRYEWGVGWCVQHARACVIVKCTQINANWPRYVYNVELFCFT